MLRNNHKGFVLMDTLLSFAVLLMITLTILPITQHLLKERHSLQVQLGMVSTLYQELLHYNENHDITKRITINRIQGTLEFTYQNKVRRGCVYWENEKNIPETKCLFIKMPPS
ncbi:hypothetical protein [Salinibacillus xinjiangensis]|uniref:Type II secretion system protein n=1 Tax=Salinibacillus xinjiangensis TaxID=1229268 RepID=A0A6G1X6Z5_9BACI|nr:hypothetical protein [Salinibacillus xinjiangensis]MRG86578.1 hypothetical protein [Salinibacillus xinjiangensis]